MENRRKALFLNVLNIIVEVIHIRLGGNSLTPVDKSLNFKLSTYDWVENNNPYLTGVTEIFNVRLGGKVTYDWVDKPIYYLKNNLYSGKILLILLIRTKLNSFGTVM